MKARILQPIAGELFSYRPGEVAEIPDREAPAWIEKGIAEAIELPADTQTPEPPAETPTVETAEAPAPEAAQVPVEAPAAAEPQTAAEKPARKGKR